ncbi:hypothetical protein LCGC14_1103900 [marine sediment metagenome]|uniref:Uncharacterized protein n=1 Tax=marine sediment metagenome TaxID=412755 RepID=A0A0F9MWM4_9ZZZZ
MEYWFRCPKCNELGAIDEEQADGKVSIVCPNCDFHKTGEVEAKVPTTRTVTTGKANRFVPLAPTMRAK